MIEIEARAPVEVRIVHEEIDYVWGNFRVHEITHRVFYDNGFMAGGRTMLMSEVEP